eukprot:836992-Amorphochlora_amoeboformis.AAC.1
MLLHGIIGCHVDMYMRLASMEHGKYEFKLVTLLTAIRKLRSNGCPNTGLEEITEENIAGNTRDYS